MGCGSIYYAKKSCESSIVTDIGAQNRYDLNFAPAGLKMTNELSTPNWTMIPGQGRTVRAPPNNFVARLARRPREARARRGRQASCRHKIGAIPSVHKRDALAWPATSIQLYVKSWPISFCAHVHEIFTIHSPKTMGLIGPTKIHRKIVDRTDINVVDRSKCAGSNRHATRTGSCLQPYVKEQDGAQRPLGY